ncbi:MAG: clostripain-related cysteine peptidase, partial [Methanopyri archaeon]|nr:clostripain-related cysteine peptidase [Methanopyri archaeon]
MYVEKEPEPEADGKEEGLTAKQVATYTAAGLGLAAVIGGAITGIGGGFLPNPPPPPGTDPQPAYVIETEQTTQGNVIDMGDYTVTLPSSIPLNYAAQDDHAQGKEWTILVYSAADNNLEGAQMEDVDDMEKTGSSKFVDVVVQVDRGTKAEGATDVGDNAWTGARRYHLQKDGTKGELTSPVLGELGQVNMADPATLTDFVEWGVKNYPAKNYLVVISDHGHGWTGSIDDDSADGHGMSWAQVQEALGKVQQRTGEKIDVLGYDACLMASTEGAYQVRGVVDYLVASEELEGAEGWPYEGIMGNRALVVMEKFSKA